jgi:metal-dependent amidase/aminoacylase/carboxypeptidase family protein
LHGHEARLATSNDDQIHQGGDVPHTSTWTLNEFVLVGGDATFDNLPPRFNQIQYAWRSPFLGIQQQIYMVLERNARHVAAMTGCSTSIRWDTKTRVGLINHAMTDLTFANMSSSARRAFPTRRATSRGGSNPTSAWNRWKTPFSTTTSG